MQRNNCDIISILHANIMTPNPSPMHTGKPGLSTLLVKSGVQNRWELQFTDWKLLISDNGSTDQTGKTGKRYSNLDARILYHRNPTNIGGANNFKFLLDEADADFFMWAAADDEWEPDFIATCLNNIRKGAGYGMAFSNIVNTDSFGRIIRHYPSLPALSGPATSRTLFRFIRDPEIMGKANLTYGIYRLDVVRNAWHRMPLSEDWGSDMCFCLAALAQGGLIIDSRVLFKKRIVRGSDNTNMPPEKIDIGGLQNLVVPLNEFFLYFKNQLKAVEKSKFVPVVFLAMISRLPSSCLAELYLSIRRMRRRVKNRLNFFR